MKTIFLISVCLLLCCCTGPVTKDKGTVESRTLSSSILNKEIEYNLYLPAAYKSAPQNFDIVYLLHGHGGDNDDWFQQEEGNVAYLLDSLISNEIIPPVIAVSVDAGNSWYVDSVEQMETFYINEFMGHIEESVNFDATKRKRFVAGNSAGGYGALRFALQYPELYKGVILLSPAAYEPLPPLVSSSRKIEAFALNGKFSDSIWKSYSYTKRMESLINSENQPWFYLSVGDDDNYNIVPVVTRLQQLFLANNISNELRVTDGGHDWETWKLSFSEALVALYSRDGTSANRLTP